MIKLFDYQIKSIEKIVDNINKFSCSWNNNPLWSWKTLINLNVLKKLNDNKVWYKIINTLKDLKINYKKHIEEDINWNMIEWNWNFPSIFKYIMPKDPKKIPYINFLNFLPSNSSYLLNVKYKKFFSQYLHNDKYIYNLVKYLSLPSRTNINFKNIYSFWIINYTKENNIIKKYLWTNIKTRQINNLIKSLLDYDNSKFEVFLYLLHSFYATYNWYIDAFNQNNSIFKEAKSNQRTMKMSDDLYIKIFLTLYNLLYNDNNYNLIKDFLVKDFKNVKIYNLIKDFKWQTEDNILFSILCYKYIYGVKLYWEKTNPLYLNVINGIYDNDLLDIINDDFPISCELIKYYMFHYVEKPKLSTDDYIFMNWNYQYLISFTYWFYYYELNSLDVFNSLSEKLIYIWRSNYVENSSRLMQLYDFNSNWIDLINNLKDILKDMEIIDNSLFNMWNNLDDIFVDNSLKNLYYSFILNLVDNKIKNNIYLVFDDLNTLPLLMKNLNIFWSSKLKLLLSWVYQWELFQIMKQCLFSFFTNSYNIQQLNLKLYWNDNKMFSSINHLIIKEIDNLNNPLYKNEIETVNIQYMQINTDWLKNDIFDKISFINDSLMHWKFKIKLIKDLFNDNTNILFSDTLLQDTKSIFKDFLSELSNITKDYVFSNILDLPKKIIIPLDLWQSEKNILRKKGKKFISISSYINNPDKFINYDYIYWDIKTISRWHNLQECSWFLIPTFLYKEFNEFFISQLLWRIDRIWVENNKKLDILFYYFTKKEKDILDWYITKKYNNINYNDFVKTIYEELNIIKEIDNIILEFNNIQIHFHEIINKNVELINNDKNISNIIISHLDFILQQHNSISNFIWIFNKSNTNYAVYNDLVNQTKEFINSLKID